MGGTNRADLEEAVDGAVEEGVAHVDDDVDLGRGERPGEAAVGHPVSLFSQLCLCGDVKWTLA